MSSLVLKNILIGFNVVQYYENSFAFFSDYRLSRKTEEYVCRIK